MASKKCSFLALLLISTLARTSSAKGTACYGWCSKSQLDWNTKCNRQSCNGCSACSESTAPALPEKPVGGCSLWCAGSGDPWPKKCTWDSCSACDECADTDKQTQDAEKPDSQTKDAEKPDSQTKDAERPGSQTKDAEKSESQINENEQLNTQVKKDEATGSRHVSNTEYCKSWCASNGNSWSKKCKWGDCIGCADCTDVSGDDEEATETPKVCSSWCESRRQAWSLKCKWDGCSGCSDCQKKEAEPNFATKEDKTESNSKENSGSKSDENTETNSEEETGANSATKLDVSAGGNQTIKLDAAKEGSCSSDSHCREGSYCSSQKECVVYDPEYCENNECGLGDADCDPNDRKGCKAGLVCGDNNCWKFHQIGYMTGIMPVTDCCEEQGNAPAVENKAVSYGPCSNHDDCGMNQFCSVKCWTGGCDKGRGKNRNQNRYYCQPCYECQKKRDSVTKSCDICETKNPGSCTSDLNCAVFSYCSSKKVCVEFDPEYCDTHSCGLGDADCDPNDAVGCEEGLVCGRNNCEQFHAIGDITGIRAQTDCCESQVPDNPPDNEQDNAPDNQKTVPKEEPAKELPAPTVAPAVTEAESQSSDAADNSSVSDSESPNPAPIATVAVAEKPETLATIKSMVTIGAQVTETEKPAAYSVCVSDIDCNADQFCGVHCWTGQCGPTGNVPRGVDGNFCQPCQFCKGPKDSPTQACDTCKAAGQCWSDEDCKQGSFCSSKNVCIEYDWLYCNTHPCGLGDGGCHTGDFVGCEEGLVCGTNNCVKFHTPLQAGMPAGSDCCEEPSASNSNVVPTPSPQSYPVCTAHSDCGTNQFCGVKCWTDSCSDGKVASGTRGRFCQPCGKCQQDGRSVSGGCSICTNEGAGRGADDASGDSMVTIVMIASSEEDTTYGACNTHLDCPARQFCGIKCWTESCVHGHVPKGSKGQFCQPCGKCLQDARSASGSCDSCGDLEIEGGDAPGSADGEIGGVGATLYPTCTAHGDCGAKEFCGVKCWTTSCVGGQVGFGTRGQFCQPCGKCQQDGRSLTGSCNVCKDPDQASAIDKPVSACRLHSDCETGNFCSFECLSGDCGVVHGEVCQACQYCASSPETSVTGSCDVCSFAGACMSDSDCTDGSYCSSKNKCVVFDSEYCDTNVCGVGDADCDDDDAIGCAPGLVCGINNCGDFHELSEATGLHDAADCCTQSSGARAGGCTSDAQCGHFSYCSSKKVCLEFDPEYCDTHSCGLGDADCDPDDAVGCAEGLVCGVNNCRKFHNFGTTGIMPVTDCCEKQSNLPTNFDQGETYPSCTAHSRCGVNQFCGVKCWTGECGPDSNAPKRRAGQFCQPCEWCNSPQDAVAGSCDVCEYRESCSRDSDCADGSYCSSKNVCVQYDSNYCNVNSCGLGDGDCDPNVGVGCAAGLVCGVDNCQKFHELSYETGMNDASDCCENGVKFDIREARAIAQPRNERNVRAAIVTKAVSFSAEFVADSATESFSFCGHIIVSATAIWSVLW